MKIKKKDIVISTVIVRDNKFYREIGIEFVCSLGSKAVLVCLPLVKAKKLKRRYKNIEVFVFGKKAIAEEDYQMSYESTKEEDCRFKKVRCGKNKITRRQVLEAAKRDFKALHSIN